MGKRGGIIAKKTFHNFETIPFLAKIYSWVYVEIFPPILSIYGFHAFKKVFESCQL